MRNLIATVSLGAMALALAGCGGGGDGGSAAPPPVAASPPPPVPPPPPPPPAPPVGTTDPVIFRASASQAFETEGRYPLTDGGIGVSFDAASKQYFVTTPANTDRQVLQRAPNFVPAPGDPWTNFVLPDGTYLLIRASGGYPDTKRYFYTNLAAWGFTGQNDFAGVTAFGLPTPQAGLPLQGAFTYSGFIEGVSDERYTSDGARFPGRIEGVISLVFDFSTGVASVSIEPTLGLNAEHSLPRITGVQLTWGRALTSFHQAVAGDPQSRNYPLTGLFTGPTGEELIGGLHLEYVSPIDGSRRTAGVAFIAKRP